MANILYAVLLDAVLLAGLALRGGGPRQRRSLATVPWLTVLVFGATAACNVAQFLDLALLSAWRRSGPALRAGNWWRLVTPLLVQDGGVAGTVFNLIALLLIGALAEEILGRWRWLALYVGVGLLTEVVAYTLIQHQGFAGNSIAIFGLAAGLALAALRGRRPPSVTAGVVCLVVGALLLVRGDLHGAAFALGLLLSGLLALWSVGSCPFPGRTS